MIFINCISCTDKEANDGTSALSVAEYEALLDQMIYNNAIDVNIKLGDSVSLHSSLLIFYMSQKHCMDCIKFNLRLIKIC